MEEFIRKQAQHSFGRTLRQDAVYTFKRSDKRKSIEINVSIRQQKINLPSLYSYKAIFASKDNTGLNLSSLSISNKHGEIRWECPIDIEELDFCRGTFDLSDNKI